jgi:hypothetical protein
MPHRRDWPRSEPSHYAWILFKSLAAAYRGLRNNVHSLPSDKVLLYPITLRRSGDDNGPADFAFDYRAGVGVTVARVAGLALTLAAGEAFSIIIIRRPAPLFSCISAIC